MNTQISKFWFFFFKHDLQKLIMIQNKINELMTGNWQFYLRVGLLTQSTIVHRILIAGICIVYTYNNIVINY